MNEIQKKQVAQRILKLYDEGHSIDYIIGLLSVDLNKDAKQYDSLTREWLIKVPKYSRQEVCHLVYETIYERHLNRIKEGG